ncbi:MAG: ADP-ribosylation factor-like protein [Promethearchaeota archaeon]
MELSEEIDASKILFTGLDYAGKSSIILALQREFSQIATLKPTRQAQRKIFEYLGKKIAEWDLGGQARYRIAYLKSPSKYFDKTSVCIYVIDIQDEARLNESLSYLKDVVDEFEKLEITPPIYIFLHKYDPALKRVAPVETEKKISEIKDQVSALIPEEFKVDFFKTSIYDLWSIMTSFSKILLALYPKSELIDKSIKDFAEKNDIQAVLVLDDNSLIIGQYFKNEEGRTILEQATPYFLTLNDSFSNTNLPRKKMIVERSGKGFYFNEIILGKNRKPLYLLLMRDDTNFDDENIEVFIKIFKELL